MDRSDRSGHDIQRGIAEPQTGEETGPAGRRQARRQRGMAVMGSGCGAATGFKGGHSRPAGGAAGRGAGGNPDDGAVCRIRRCGPGGRFRVVHVEAAGRGPHDHVAGGEQGDGRHGHEQARAPVGQKQSVRLHRMRMEGVADQRHGGEHEQHGPRIRLPQPARLEHPCGPCEGQHRRVDDEREHPREPGLHAACHGKHAERVEAQYEGHERDGDGQRHQRPQRGLPAPHSSTSVISAHAAFAAWAMDSTSCAAM